MILPSIPTIPTVAETATMLFTQIMLPIALSMFAAVGYVLKHLLVEEEPGA